METTSTVPCHMAHLTVGLDTEFNDALLQTWHKQSKALKDFAEQAAGRKDEALLNGIAPDDQRTMEVHMEPANGAAAMEGNRTSLEQKNQSIDDAKVNVQQKRDDFKGKACAVVPGSQDERVSTGFEGALVAMAQKNDDVVEASKCPTTKDVVRKFKPNDPVPMDKEELKKKSREVKDELQKHRVEEGILQAKQLLQAIEANQVYGLFSEAVRLSEDDGMFAQEHNFAETKKGDSQKMSADYQANKKELEKKISTLGEHINRLSKTHDQNEADLQKQLQLLAKSWEKFVSSKRQVEWDSEQLARLKSQLNSMDNSLTKMNADLAEVNKTSNAVMEKASKYRDEAIACRKEATCAVAEHHRSSLEKFANSLGFVYGLLKKADDCYKARKEEAEEELKVLEQKQCEALEANDSDEAQDLGSDISTCKETIDAYDRVLTDIEAVSKREAVAIQRLKDCSSSNPDVHETSVLQAYKTGLESISKFFELESRPQQSQAARQSNESTLAISAQEETFARFKEQVRLELIKLRTENHELKEVNKRQRTALKNEHESARKRQRLEAHSGDNEEEEEEEEEREE